MTGLDARDVVDAIHVVMTEIRTSGCITAATAGSPRGVQHPGSSREVNHAYRSTSSRLVRPTGDQIMIASLAAKVPPDCHTDAQAGIALLQTIRQSRGIM